MSRAAIARARSLEAWAARQPQVHLEVEHFLHAGTYSRTVIVPAGVMITGALIRIPTLLIAAGDALLYYGDFEPLRLSGFTVLRAEAGRKQAFVAITDLSLTMVFASRAATVEDAEAEFTDEVGLLQSRRLFPAEEDPQCLA